MTDKQIVDMGKTVIESIEQAANVVRVDSLISILSSLMYLSIEKPST